MKAIDQGNLVLLTGGIRNSRKQNISGCISSGFSAVVGIVGIGLLIAFPPASLAVGMGSALAGGLGLGASLGGMYTSC